MSQGSSAGPLKGKRIAFLVANEGVEEVELTRPWEAVREAGGKPELIAPRPGEVQAFDHLDRGATFEVDRAVKEADPRRYDAVVLPGGVANADRLRMEARAISFLRSFFDQHKVVATICHAPWALIEADVVRHRTLTSWPSLKTDLRNAGAHWVDEPFHDDDGLLSSRRPADLDAFCAGLLRRVAEGSPAHERAA